MEQKHLYECRVCHLHYEDEEIANQCATYCKENQSCSLDITKLSVERKNAAEVSARLDTKTN